MGTHTPTHPSTASASAGIVVLAVALAVSAAVVGPHAQAPAWREISGVYPHLAMFNSGQECGTGAVVPWAGRLWAITYAPHQPFGSDDKLYEIDARLNQSVRAESIGGTPANRFIHRESNQLFIGPYVIDGAGAVRVEVDLTGTGLWVRYAMLNVPPGRVLEHRFPDGYGAYWVSFIPLTDARATAQLIYGGASR